MVINPPGGIGIDNDDPLVPGGGGLIDPGDLDDPINPDPGEPINPDPDPDPPEGGGDPEGGGGGGEEASPPPAPSSNQTTEPLSTIHLTDIHTVSSPLASDTAYTTAGLQTGLQRASRATTATATAYTGARNIPNDMSIVYASALDTPETIPTCVPVGWTMWSYNIGSLGLAPDIDGMLGEDDAFGNTQWYHVSQLDSSAGNLLDYTHPGGVKLQSAPPFNNLCMLVGNLQLALNRTYPNTFWVGAHGDGSKLFIKDISTTPSSITLADLTITGSNGTSTTTFGFNASTTVHGTAAPPNDGIQTATMSITPRTIMVIDTPDGVGTPPAGSPKFGAATQGMYGGIGGNTGGGWLANGYVDIIPESLPYVNIDDLVMQLINPIWDPQAIGVVNGIVSPAEIPRIWTYNHLYITMIDTVGFESPANATFGNGWFGNFVANGAADVRHLPYNVWFGNPTQVDLNIPNPCLQIPTLRVEYDLSTQTAETVVTLEHFCSVRNASIDIISRQGGNNADGSNMGTVGGLTYSSVADLATKLQPYYDREYSAGAITVSANGNILTLDLAPYFITGAWGDLTTLLGSFNATQTQTSFATDPTYARPRVPNIAGHHVVDPFIDFDFDYAHIDLLLSGDGSRSRVRIADCYPIGYSVFQRRLTLGVHSAYDAYASQLTQYPAPNASNFMQSVVHSNQYALLSQLASRHLDTPETAICKYDPSTRTAYRSLAYNYEDPSSVNGGKDGSGGLYDLQYLLWASTYTAEGIHRGDEGATTFNAPTGWYESNLLGPYYRAGFRPDGKPRSERWFSFSVLHDVGICGPVMSPPTTNEPSSNHHDNTGLHQPFYLTAYGSSVTPYDAYTVPGGGLVRTGTTWVKLFVNAYGQFNDSTSAEHLLFRQYPYSPTGSLSSGSKSPWIDAAAVGVYPLVNMAPTDTLSNGSQTDAWKWRGRHAYGPIHTVVVDQRNRPHLLVAYPTLTSATNSHPAWGLVLHTDWGGYESTTSGTTTWKYGFRRNLHISDPTASYLTNFHLDYAEGNVVDITADCNESGEVHFFIHHESGTTNHLLWLPYSPDDTFNWTPYNILNLGWDEAGVGPSFGSPASKGAIWGGYRSQLTQPRCNWGKPHSELTSWNRVTNNASPETFEAVTTHSKLSALNKVGGAANIDNISVDLRTTPGGETLGHLAALGSVNLSFASNNFAVMTSPTGTKTNGQDEITNPIPFNGFGTKGHHQKSGLFSPCGGAAGFIHASHVGTTTLLNVTLPLSTSHDTLGNLSGDSGDVAKWNTYDLASGCVILRWNSSENISEGQQVFLEQTARSGQSISAGKYLKDGGQGGIWAPRAKLRLTPDVATEEADATKSDWKYIHHVVPRKGALNGWTLHQVLPKFDNAVNRPDGWFGAYDANAEPDRSYANFTSGSLTVNYGCVKTIPNLSEVGLREFSHIARHRFGTNSFYITDTIYTSVSDHDTQWTNHQPYNSPTTNAGAIVQRWLRGCLTPKYTGTNVGAASRQTAEFYDLWRWRAEAKEKVAQLVNTTDIDQSSPLGVVVSRSNPLTSPVRTAISVLSAPYSRWGYLNEPVSGSGTFTAPKIVHDGRLYDISYHLPTQPLNVSTLNSDTLRGIEWDWGRAKRGSTTDGSDKTRIRLLIENASYRDTATVNGQRYGSSYLETTHMHTLPLNYAFKRNTRASRLQLLSTYGSLTTGHFKNGGMGSSAIVRNNPSAQKMLKYSPSETIVDSSQLPLGGKRLHSIFRIHMITESEWGYSIQDNFESESSVAPTKFPITQINGLQYSSAAGDGASFVNSVYKTPGEVLCLMDQRGFIHIIQAKNVVTYSSTYSITATIEHIISKKAYPTSLSATDWSSPTVIETFTRTGLTNELEVRGYHSLSADIDNQGTIHLVATYPLSTNGAEFGTSPTSGLLCDGIIHYYRKTDKQWVTDGLNPTDTGRATSRALVNLTPVDFDTSIKKGGGGLTGQVCFTNGYIHFAWAYCTDVIDSTSLTIDEYGNVWVAWSGASTWASPWGGVSYAADHKKYKVYINKAKLEGGGYRFPRRLGKWAAPDTLLTDGTNLPFTESGSALQRVIGGIDTQMGDYKSVMLQSNLNGRMMISWVERDNTTPLNDYVGLQIFDYDEAITHPYDIGIRAHNGGITEAAGNIFAGPLEVRTGNTGAVGEYREIRLPNLETAGFIYDYSVRWSNKFESWIFMTQQVSNGRVVPVQYTIKPYLVPYYFNRVDSNTDNSNTFDYDIQPTIKGRKWNKHPIETAYDQQFKSFVDNASGEEIREADHAGIGGFIQPRFVSDVPLYYGTYKAVGSTDTVGGTDLSAVIPYTYPHRTIGTSLGGSAWSATNHKGFFMLDRPTTSKVFITLYDEVVDTNVLGSRFMRNASGVDTTHATRGSNAIITPIQPLNELIYINGIPVEDTISINFSSIENASTQVSIEIANPEGMNENKYQVMDEVVVYTPSFKYAQYSQDNTSARVLSPITAIPQRAFTGYVNSINSGGNRIQIKCFDNLGRLSQEIISSKVIYQQVDVGIIIKDIIANADFTHDLTGVETKTGITINQSLDLIGKTRLDAILSLMDKLNIGKKYWFITTDANGRIMLTHNNEDIRGSITDDIVLSVQRGANLTQFANSYVVMGRSSEIINSYTKRVGDEPLVQRFLNEQSIGNKEEASDFAQGLVEASNSKEGKVNINLLPIRFDIPLLSRWRFLAGKSGFNGSYYVKAVRWGLNAGGATLTVSLGNRPATPLM